jgi:hypothetical protein
MVDHTSENGDLNETTIEKDGKKNERNINNLFDNNDFLNIVEKTTVSKFFFFFIIWRRKKKIFFFFLNRNLNMI